MNPVLALALAGAAFLTGCSQKPPGCADSETMALAKKMVVEGILANLTAQINQERDPKARDDLQQLANKYAAGLKVSMSQVVSNGYNAEAKKYQCAGKLAIGTPQGDEFEVTTAFSTQRTADSNDNFVLQIEQYQPIFTMVFNQFIPYMATQVGPGKGQAKELGPAQAPQSASTTAGAPAPPPEGKIKYTKEGGSASLEVTGPQVKFDMMAVRGQGDCALEGTAVMVDATRAEYRSQDKGDQCVVQFKFLDGGLEVATNRCDGHCGMGADGAIDGIYKR